jgi:L-lactate dehydrogenase complex protein LldF
MLVGLRELQHHTRRPSAEAFAYKLWQQVLRRPWLYRLALLAARMAMRPLAKDGWFQRLPGPGRAWTSVRDFPAPAARSFRERWRELQ